MRKPRIKDTILEGVRTGQELLSTAFNEAGRAILPKALKPEFGKAHDMPVLVLPGFTAPNVSTYPLRRELSYNGYITYGSEALVNIGFSQKLLDLQSRQIEKIFNKHGGNKIAIIGHSLGGAQGFYHGYNHPDMIGKIITLGSPIGFTQAPTGVAKPVLELYNLVNINDDPLLKASAQHIENGPPDMPTSCIYSAHDGVLTPIITRNPFDECPSGKHVSIEIDPKHKQSHCGMAASQPVFKEVLLRLDSVRP